MCVTTQPQLCFDSAEDTKSDPDVGVCLERVVCEGRVSEASRALAVVY